MLGLLPWHKCPDTGLFLKKILSLFITSGNSRHGINRISLAKLFSAFCGCFLKQEKYVEITVEGKQFFFSKSMREEGINKQKKIPDQTWYLLFGDNLLMFWFVLSDVHLARRFMLFFWVFVIRKLTLFFNEILFVRIVEMNFFSRSTLWHDYRFFSQAIKFWVTCCVL